MRTNKWLALPMIVLMVGSVATKSYSTSVHPEILMVKKDGYIEFEMKSKPVPAQNSEYPASVYDVYDAEVSEYSSVKPTVTVGGNGDSYIQGDILHNSNISIHGSGSPGGSGSGGSSSDKDDEDDEDKDKSEEDEELEEEEEIEGCDCTEEDDCGCKGEDEEECSCGSGGGGGSSNYESNVDIESSISIEGSIPVPIPRIAITEIYSINDTLTDVSYKPSFSDLPNLKTIVEKYAMFNYAGTEYFNTKATPVNDKLVTATRALEILGYDSLLLDEQYVNVGGVYKYKATRATENVTLGLSLMDIYKALDINMYYYTFVHEARHIDQMSTATQNQIAKFYQERNIDTTRGYTGVFTSRTILENYIEKAVNDNLVAGEGNDWTRTITAGEFITILKDFMTLYGEPELTSTEQNMLLQLIGAEIPSYLTDREMDAFIYLRSRGILSSDTIDYTKALKLNDMLDILMRVKDESSRETFKNVQPVLQLDDELISMGYFPKTLNLAQENNAVVTDYEYDYSQAKYLDYYVIVDNNTVFTDTKGNQVSELYVPSDRTYISPPVLGSSFQGISDNLYHFIIPVEHGKSSGKVVVNTKTDDDLPGYLELEYGGGMYLNSEPKDNYTYLSRESFRTSEYKGKVDIDRISGKETKLSRGVKSIIGLFAIPLYAADIDSVNIGTGAKLELKVKNLSTIANLDELKAYYRDLHVVEADDYIIIKTDESLDRVLSRIKVRKVTSNNNFTYHKVISGIKSESVLISYDELKDKGLILGDTIPLPSNEGKTLTLETIYGTVTLDKNTNTIVVGNTVYNLANGSLLYNYTKKDDGTNELFIDFRAAYGWSADTIKFEQTGEGDLQTISIFDKSSYDSNLSKMELRPVWASGNGYKVLVREEDNKKYLLLSSSYPLGNYFVWRGTDNSLLQDDRMYVSYLKQGYDSLGIELPTNETNMIDDIGYSIDNTDWFISGSKLSYKEESKVGKVVLGEDYGYLYVLPTTEEFTLDKYFKGEYLLPYSYDATTDIILDHNINYFQGYDFGVSPTEEYSTYSATNLGSKGRIDYKGKVITDTDDEQDIGEASEDIVERVIPAPSGLVSYLPFNKTSFLELSSIALKSDSKFYYGTMPISVTKHTDTSSRELLYKAGIGRGNQVYFYIKPDCKFYNNGKANGMNIFSMTGIGGVEVGSVAQDEEKGLLITDGDNADNLYKEFDWFSISTWLMVINSLLEFILEFTIVVVPYIGFTGLTVLLGISFMTGNKPIEWLFEKTFDPVKILTFGRKEFQELDFKETFFAVVMGYIAFAMLLRGNALKIILFGIELVVEVFSRIT